MSASTHSDASVAYSIPFTNKDYGYDLELPDNVSSYSDLRKKARSKSRNQSIQLANLYSEIKQLLKNYDSAAEQMLEQIENFDFDLEAEDIRNSLEDMENKNVAPSLETLRDFVESSDPNIISVKNILPKFFTLQILKLYQIVVLGERLPIRRTPRFDGFSNLVGLTTPITTH